MSQTDAAPASEQTPRPFEVLQQEYDPAYPVAQLTPHPANPNDGDQGLLSEVLAENGFAGVLLVQKATGIIIDGETRYHVARAHNVETLPVMLVDCDDDARDRFLAEWNETTRRGRNDETRLLALLQGLTATPRGLAGAGFDGDDLDRLISQMSGPLNLGDAPTGARNAEDPEDEDARRDAIAGYKDRKDGGDLVEMILVYSTAGRAEVGQLVDRARALFGDPDKRNADVILDALRCYVAELERVEATVPAGAGAKGGD
jgi:hypothetical protein